jgi:hypothetical protein
MPFPRRILGPALLGLFASTGVFALLSVLAHHERSAQAAPRTVVVATESCSHTFTSGLDTFLYAEHAFPTASSYSLAGVRVVGHMASQQGIPPGYENVNASSSLYVRNGAVAVVCGNKAWPVFDKVAFFFTED